MYIFLWIVKFADDQSYSNRRPPLCGVALTINRDREIDCGCSERWFYFFSNSVRRTWKVGEDDL